MKKVNCPICGSDRYKLMLKSNQYRWVKCQGCSLVYINPRPSSKEIQQVYSQNYYQGPEEEVCSYIDYLKDKDNLQEEFSKRLSKIKKIFSLPAKASLLDVGCATGFFLEVAQKEDFKAEGLEISKWAADFGRKKLGLKIHHGTMESIKAPREKFDLITIWDVIEHIEDLNRFLKVTKDLLKDNGKLVITTPNIQSWIAQVKKDRWANCQAAPAHLVLFSPKTIRYLLERHNFKIIKIETKENFGNFLHHLQNFCKNRFLFFRSRDRVSKKSAHNLLNKQDQQQLTICLVIKLIIKKILKSFLFIGFVLIYSIVFCNRKGELITVYAKKL